MKRVPRRISETRELTDKELSEITTAMGDNVRSQSLHVSNIIQANLKAEFAAYRKKTPALIKTRKSVTPSQFHYRPESQDPLSHKRR